MMTNEPEEKIAEILEEAREEGAETAITDAAAQIAIVETAVAAAETMAAATEIAAAETVVAVTRSLEDEVAECRAENQRLREEMLSLQSRITESLMQQMEAQKTEIIASIQQKHSELPIPEVTTTEVMEMTAPRENAEGDLLEAPIEKPRRRILI